MVPMYLCLTGDRKAQKVFGYFSATISLSFFISRGEVSTRPPATHYFLIRKTCGRCVVDPHHHTEAHSAAAAAAVVPPPPSPRNPLPLPPFA